MRSFIVAAFAALTFTTSASAAIDSYMTFHPDEHGQCRDSHGHFAAAEKCRKSAPHCDKGKPCGDTCIPKNHVCHVGH